MKIRLLVATLSVLLAAGAVPALADVGETRAVTRVYVTQNINSDIVGVLTRGTQVEGQCYTNSWCQVSGGGLSGWVESVDLNMRPTAQPQPLPTPQAPGEQGPRPQPTPSWPWPNPTPQPQPVPQPTPQPPVTNQAQVCFFSEQNFRGPSFCVTRGNSYPRLSNWDNAIRSIQVYGGARVRMCSDAGLTGECANLREDASPLPGWLDGYTSSLRVY